MDEITKSMFSKLLDAILVLIGFIGVPDIFPPALVLLADLPMVIIVARSSYMVPSLLPV